MILQTSSLWPYRDLWVNTSTLIWQWKHTGSQCNSCSMEVACPTNWLQLSHDLLSSTATELSTTSSGATPNRGYYNNPTWLSPSWQQCFPSLEVAIAGKSASDGNEQIWLQLKTWPSRNSRGSRSNVKRQTWLFMGKATHSNKAEILKSVVDKSTHQQNLCPTEI